MPPKKPPHRLTLIIPADQKLYDACQQNDLAQAQEAIEEGANILQEYPSAQSLLAITSCPQICELLINTAIKKDVLKQLMSIGNEDSNPYSSHCRQKNATIIELLINIPNYESYLSPRKMAFFMHYARLAAWSSSQTKSRRFDQICQIIRPSVTQYSAIPFNPKTSEILWFSKRITNRRYPTSIVKAKDKVIKSFSALLRNPQRCIPYLQQVNDELIRYYEEKHNADFPQMRSNNYKFEKIHGLYYPIPNENYQSIKKHSSLSEFLICLFQQHGLANKTYKWLGYVAQQVAGKTIKDGNFFSEIPIGSNLFHGKLAHMLQLAILIYAIEADEINPYYKDSSGELCKLTLTDLLEAFILNKDHNNDATWLGLLDTRCYGYINFSDPHRLYSVIMHDGESLGLAVLSNYLTDSFCKGWLKTLDAFREVTHFKTMDNALLLTHVKDLQLNAFFTLPRIIQYYLRNVNEKGKTSHEMIQHHDGYLVLESHYELNASFCPKLFSVPQRQRILDAPQMERCETTFYGKWSR